MAQFLLINRSDEFGVFEIDRYINKSTYYRRFVPSFIFQIKNLRKCLSLFNILQEILTVATFSSYGTLFYNLYSVSLINRLCLLAFNVIYDAKNSRKYLVAIFRIKNLSKRWYHSWYVVSSS